jgi:hypothetical protein
LRSRRARIALMQLFSADHVGALIAIAPSIAPDAQNS